jgi:hypothetical protein
VTARALLLPAVVLALAAQEPAIRVTTRLVEGDARGGRPRTRRPAQSVELKDLASKLEAPGGAAMP